MTTVDFIISLSKHYSTCIWKMTGADYKNLVWSDENTIPKPTEEDLTSKYNQIVAERPFTQLRKRRNKALAETDKYAIPDWPHATTEVKQAWFDYRQALRDLPANTEDPVNPVWPTRPDKVVNTETVTETSNTETVTETSN